MAEGYQNKYVDEALYQLNDSVAYSTNAEMLSAISNYVGSVGYSRVKFFAVRCSEAPLSGSAVNVIFLGSNLWGGGIGFFNSGDTRLIKIGFGNGVGYITQITQ